MKRTGFYFSIFLSSLILFSCGGNDKSISRKSSGKTAELIVATNNEATWEGEIGDTVRSFFNQDYQVLPQSEPLFELVHIPINSLTNSKIFKAHHNILIIDIDEKAKKNSIEARKDFWSAPQRVVRIVSPSKDEFISYWEKKKNAILDILMDSEHERLINIFNAFPARDVKDAIAKKFNFNLTIPGGFYVAKNFPEFMWIRKETEHNSQGLIIYTYDFVDTLAFNKERIISFQNSITEEYIPGPSEGSYMTVATEYAPIISKQIDFNGMFAIETRGLWRLEGDFMGGPFVNYTFVDEKSNKVITMVGYVYAPNAPKRDLMIQMEAIIYSFKESK